MKQEKPYWMGIPGKKVLERIEKMRAWTKNEVRTVRNLCYKLYPGLEGKLLDRAYNTTIKAVVRGRIANLIPWNKIRESRVELHNGVGWQNTDEFVKSRTENIWEYYSRDKTPSHTCYVECWFEKDTVSREFTTVCGKYDVPYMAARGQLTWTAKKVASERLVNGNVILYFGDNDDGGKEIFEVIKRDLKYLGCGVELVWVAITEKQEREYGLPPRAKLDGFELTDLREIIEGEIQKYINLAVFQKILKQEKQDIEFLKRLVIKVK